jgi:hypothetical protein
MYQRFLDCRCRQAYASVKRLESEIIHFLEATPPSKVQHGCEVGLEPGEGIGLPSASDGLSDDTRSCY